MSELEKMTDRRLADEFGTVNKSAKVEAARLEALKAELKRRGKSIYRGTSFDVTKAAGGRNQLDTKAIALEMGEAWIKARKKFVSWFEWNAIPKDPDAADEVAPAPTPPPRPSKASKALQAV